MAPWQPLPHTLLPLHTYAKLFGINPLHFSRGATPGLGPVVMPDGGCNSLWAKYDWQHADQVSWYQLAEQINVAEEEIASIIGWWPAPVWIEAELHTYPRPFDPSVFGYGRDVRLTNKSMLTKWGKVIASGRRAVSLVGTATVAAGTLVYSDEDGDGFFETATITLATALTDKREIKVYYAGEAGAPDAEVRPVRSVTITGGNVVIVLDAWLLIEPELYEDYPVNPDRLEAIDVSTTGNYVTSVDVYREYVDNTQPTAVFYWEQGIGDIFGLTCPVCGGEGCAVCGYIVQDGCLTFRDFQNGIAAPYPATYSETDGVWNRAGWSVSRDPDVIKVYYRAGNQDERFVRGLTTDPLSMFWAQTIAWLATARLERPLCACGNAQDLWEDLRMDLTHNTQNDSHFVTGDVMDSPFGTRKGEVMAWRRIKRIVRDRRLGVALV